MTSIDERTALADKRAAEIAAIGRQRLRYWEKTDLITPDVERVISPRNVVRLYSMPRVVELVVASELRQQGVSLQHIRRIVEHLRSGATRLPCGRCGLPCLATGSCSSMQTDRGRIRVVRSRV